MVLRITQLGVELQTLLTTEAEKAAQESGFVKRRRKLTGPVFVQTLVGGWLADPTATLEALVDPDDRDQPLCSPQALDQRFGVEAVDCLRRVLEAALRTVVAARAEPIPLLRRFHGVHVEDCTTISLPAALAAQFSGCGGGGTAGSVEGGAAAVKIHVRWEVTTGALSELTLHAGRQPDVVAAQSAAALPAGSLRLADQGFFDLAVLRRQSEQGVHWISRLPAGVLVALGEGPSQGLSEFLAGRKGPAVDVAVVLGVERNLSCRLIAFRCPPAVAARRLEKLEKKASKKGRKVSERQRALCHWTVFITDLPPEKLSPEEAWVLYRARWQVELLFKQWKSHGGLDRSRARKPQRVLAEVYAKLIGLVIRHWLVLLRGGCLAGFSWVRAIRCVARGAGLILRALREGESLQQPLERLSKRLFRLRRRARRKTSPSTRQLLFQPRVMG
jgi:Transposase DDE domain